MKAAALLISLLGLSTALAASPEFRQIKLEGPDLVLDLPNGSAWELFVDRGNLREWDPVPHRVERPAGLGVLRFRVARTDVLRSSAFFRAGSLTDPDEDGLPSGREILLWGSDPQAADSDGDGFLDGADEDPSDAWNNQLPHLTRLSAASQFGNAGIFLPQPLEVLVTDAAGVPVEGKPVVFHIQAGGGKISSSCSVTPPANTPATLTVLTSSGGVARAWWLCGSDTVQRASAGVMARKNRAGQGGGIAIVEFAAWAGNLALPADASFFLPPCPDTVDAPLDLWVDRAARLDSRRFGAISGSLPSAHPAVTRCAGLGAVQFDGVDDTLKLTPGLPDNGTFTVCALCMPVAPIITSAASLAFNNRTAGRSGQRYLLAGEVARGVPPWKGEFAKPADRFFSVWRNYRYNKEDGFLDKTYTTAADKPPASARPQGAPAALWDEVDNTADDLRESGGTRTPLSSPRPLAEIMEKDIKPKLETQSPGWVFAPQTLPVSLSRFIFPPPVPPKYTARRIAGEPLWTEESYHFLEPVSYTPRDLTPASLPVLESPASAGWALSVGENAAAIFELRDDTLPASLFAHLAGFYPCEGTANSSLSGGWSVITAVRNLKNNALTAHIPAESVAGNMIVSSSKIVTGPVYLGGQPEVPGNHFAGCIGGLILLPKAASQTESEDCEDTLMQLAGLARDRNANGVTDAWEKHLLPLPNRSALSDPDGDGLNNRIEFQQGTNPLGRDSDGDTSLDTAEASRNNRRDIFDSDADGFPDATDDGRLGRGKDGQADANLDRVPDGWPAFLGNP